MLIEPQDRVTGEIDRAGEVHAVLVELPAGAKIKFKLARKGKSGLVPAIIVRAPDGSDQSAAFTLREKRGGALVAGGVAALSVGGTWRLEISGATDTLGIWSLKFSAKQKSKFRGDVIAPAAGDGEFAFDVFAGSELKFSLRDAARVGEPVLSGVAHDEAGALSLATAKTKLRRGTLSVSRVATTTTGAHLASARLAGNGGGTVSVSLRAKSEKPRKMTLVHPGETLDLPLALSTLSLPRGQVDALYAATVSATGGTPGYSFSVTLGDLPDGLALATSGAVTGTPTAAGNFAFTVEVTDSAAPSDRVTRALSIDVDAVSTGVPEWRELAPSGAAPAGRSSPGAVYDPDNERMVISLGSTGSSGFPPVFGDTRAVALGAPAAWATLGTGPTARWGHSFVFDSLRDRAILFGGNVNGFQTGNDVWALDLSTSNATWTQLTPTGGTPPTRVAHTAVYDPDNDRMVVFGGGTGVAPGVNSSTAIWELSFASSAQGVWTERSPASPPAAREFTASVFDVPNRRMVIFGGMTTGTQFDDVWSLDLTTPGSEVWTVLSPSGASPSARDEHSAVYDSRRGTMVVFGGLVGNSDTNDVYELDLTAGSESWAKLAPTGTLPTARDSHVAVYDPEGRRMVVFSGFDGFPSTPFDDIWELLLP